MPIDVALRRLVRMRAGNRCEYCRCRQDELPFVTFHVEHVIARQHGGGDEESNLCLSCHWCNFQKGTNIATQIDGQLVPLFNPRVDNGRTTLPSRRTALADALPLDAERFDSWT